MVRRLASAIHEERAFERLPILADALEEAGCVDPNILEHCRGREECCHREWLATNPSAALEDYRCVDCGAPGNQQERGWRRLRGPHVRGCWVVDLCRAL